MSYPITWDGLNAAEINAETIDDCLSLGYIIPTGAPPPSSPLVVLQGATEFTKERVIVHRDVRTVAVVRDPSAPLTVT